MPQTGLSIATPLLEEDLYNLYKEVNTHPTLGLSSTQEAQMRKLAHDTAQILDKWVKEMVINYIGGLANGGGSVTGTMQYEII